MQLHNLELGPERCHSVAQSLEATRLRLHQVSPVVTAPLIPAAKARRLAHSELGYMPSSLLRVTCFAANSLLLSRVQSTSVRETIYATQS